MWEGDVRELGGWLIEATTWIGVEGDTDIQVVVRLRLQELEPVALDRGHCVIAMVQDVLVVHQSWRGEAGFQKRSPQQWQPILRQHFERHFSVL